ncbi:hypothetical protein [Endozoicomonas sp. G2_2]|uniref:hypothetical protein n=1 Tax=Endozoicomonas sp. G2_2 TaxID=2821092 RepID=UPI001ADB200B|nr:hypothetical protein [Endozoicomonas sp. G2_2]
MDTKPVRKKSADFRMADTGGQFRGACRARVRDAEQIESAASSVMLRPVDDEMGRWGHLAKRG